MKFYAVLEAGENNWSGYFPDVPGCVSTGKNRDALIENMREALSFHLEGILEDRDEIPISQYIPQPEDDTVELRLELSAYAV